jgi:acyl-CoA thioesterase YciA
MSEKRDPTLRVTLLPRDTNRHGSIFGGVILSHVDLAGAIEARKSCGPLNFVTVALDRVVFHKPVFVGDVVSLYAETVKVGRTSVIVRVIVEATRMETEGVVRVTEADVVYVAVDKDWKPVPIR